MTLWSAVFVISLVQTPGQPLPPGFEASTPHTIRLQAGQEPAKTTLADVEWLAGTWRGQGLGGVTEETWSAPAGGSMMGMFRLMRGDAVVFYEFMTLVRENGSVVMKLKHFNPDLAGWEDKDKWVTFRLASATPQALFFEGLTFRRIDDDSLRIFLAIRDRETGAVREEAFSYERVRAAPAPRP